MLFHAERPALSRWVWVLVAVVVVAAVAGIEYEVGLGSSSGGTREIDIQIFEDNPVLQLDHFYPDTVYVSLGQTVQIAVLNTDDETRLFTISKLNINVSMASGTTQRVTFQANQLGNFSFLSPITPPSPVSNGRKGPCLEGFFVVTQNATLISATHSGTGVAPSVNQSLAASNGAIGGCTSSPLTVA